MVAAIFVLTGIGINAIGTIFYLISTLRGKVKPNRVTFLVWSIAPLVVFFAQLSKHVGVQSLMTLSIGIFPLSIFIASFVNKKSYWKLSFYDKLCGLLSLIGLMLWYITKEGNVAIFFSLFSEGLATLPTVIKAYNYPETEHALPWLASAAGGICTIVTITQWNFAIAAFPIFYTLEMFSIFFLAWIKVGQTNLQKV